MDNTDSDDLANDSTNNSARNNDSTMLGEQFEDFRRSGDLDLRAVVKLLFNRLRRLVL